MIVPASTTLLEANPHFAKLHDHLIQHILTPTGLNRTHLTANQSLQTDLNTAQYPLIRDRVLLKALSELPANLPAPLHEALANIISYISLSLDNARFPPDTETLLAPELSLFRENLPVICRVLSQYLKDLHESLPKSTNDLSEEVSSLVSDVADLRTQLPAALSSLSTTCASFLDGGVIDLESRIRHLELFQHGSEARHITARAGYLANVAREVELKAHIRRLEREKELLSDQKAVRKLEEEFARLQVEEVRLMQREKELEELLDEYEAEGRRDEIGTSGQKQRGVEVFKVLVERYEQAEIEIEALKRDIESLETQVWRGR